MHVADRDPLKNEVTERAVIGSVAEAARDDGHDLPARRCLALGQAECPSTPVESANGFREELVRVGPVDVIRARIALVPDHATPPQLTHCPLARYRINPAKRAGIGPDRRRENWMDRAVSVERL